MSLQKICRLVQIQVHDLGAYIWQEDQTWADKSLQAELENKCRHLADEIWRRTNLAARFHTGLIELQRRLAHHEKEAADLLKRAKVFHQVGDRANAWHHSLHLDQLRQVVAHERSRLQVQERMFGNQMDQVRRLRQRLTHLQDQITL